jgi:hypothetical protein
MHGQQIEVHLLLLQCGEGRPSVEARNPDVCVETKLAFRQLSLLDNDIASRPN